MTGDDPPRDVHTGDDHSGDDDSIGESRPAGGRPDALSPETLAAARPDEEDAEIDAALALHGVSKGYGRVRALDGADFTVAPGTFAVLAGPNGSGKTTALRLFAGLSRPDAGRVDGPPGRVGVAFQQPAVYDALTARENLAVFADLVGAGDAWRERLVDALGLGPALHRPVGALSDGFRKKLDLALSLLGRPAVCLLDEPLADLDERTRRRVVALLAAYAAPGRIVLVSSHRIERFGPHLEQLTVLVGGRVRRSVAAPALEAPPAAVYHGVVAAASAAAGTDERGND